MRVLVACEFSGIVREAFRKYGHDAWSCDIIPSRWPGQHMRCDVRKALEDGWDLMVAHPPCTHLAVSGARLFKYKVKQQAQALEFFQLLLECPYISRIAVENPVGVVSTRLRQPDQYIQPYEYGHPSRKKTCLWLKSLPLLEPTNIVKPILVEHGGKKYSHDLNISKGDRARRRSTTYVGVALAMAQQWGCLPCE